MDLNLSVPFFKKYQRISMEYNEFKIFLEDLKGETDPVKMKFFEAWKHLLGRDPSKKNTSGRGQTSIRLPQPQVQGHGTRDKSCQQVQGEVKTKAKSKAPFNISQSKGQYLRPQQPDEEDGDLR